MSEPTPPPSRRAWKWLRRALNASILVLLALALIGRAVRDRGVVLALMMYLPLLPIGFIAIATDALQRGRAAPRIKYGLLVAGVIGSSWALLSLASFGAPAPSGSSALR